MVKFVNRCKHVVASAPGTGSVTFGAAMAGFQSLAQANLVNSDVVRYTIEDGDNFESGTGVIGLSGSTYTMARTPVTSSNSDNAITVTADAEIFLTALASDIVQFADDLSDVDTTTAAPVTGNALMWNYATSKWSPAHPNGAQVVATTTALLAISSPSAGAIVYVSESAKVYMYTGSEWFAIATLSNSPPTAVTGVDATYELSDLGTVTTITAASSDPELFPLTWSYAATGLGNIATIAQTDNVFVVTPSASTAGTFSLVITATDSGNLTSQASASFSLSFGTWAVPTFKASLSAEDYSTSGGGQAFGQAVISGDGTTIAVMQTRADNPATSVSDHTQFNIYTLVSGTWTFQSAIIPPNSVTNDDFRDFDLSNDGNTFITTRFTITSADNLFLYTRSSGVWSLSDSINWDTARRSNVLTLSADGASALLLGLNSSNYRAITEITISGGSMTAGTAATSGLGTTAYAMEMSKNGSRAVVRIGSSAKIYHHDGTSWASTITSGPTHTFPTADPRNLAISGDGNVVVIGDQTADSNSGEAEAFVYDGSSWSTATTLQPSAYGSATSTSNKFGANVQLNHDGTKLAVVAFGEHDNFPATTSGGTGAIYFFTRSGTSWTQLGRATKPTLSSGGQGTRFGGYGLSMDSAGYHIVAKNDSAGFQNEGAAQIFTEGK